MAVNSLLRVSLTAADPVALAGFYVSALGFEIETQMAGGVLGAEQTIRLRYSDSVLEILGFAEPGRNMPAGQTSNDRSFQHFAMIVNDIGAAYETLRQGRQFSAVSTAGPVKLPPASGGATAFKFRDPEGHPLELLQPLRDATKRIDHTAIVVADSQASVNFYAAYGLSVQSGSLNFGPEQAALDGLNEPIVKVTRLAGAGPLALELLCYHQPAGTMPIPGKISQDAWASRLVFKSDGATCLLRDPDGHDILMEGAENAL